MARKRIDRALVGDMPYSVRLSEATHEKLSHLRDTFKRPRTVVLKPSQSRYFSHSEITRALYTIALGNHSSELKFFYAASERAHEFTPQVGLDGKWVHVRFDSADHSVLWLARQNILAINRWNERQFSLDGVISVVYDMALDAHNGDVVSLGGALVARLV